MACPIRTTGLTDDERDSLLDSLVEQLDVEPDVRTKEHALRKRTFNERTPKVRVRRVRLVEYLDRTDE